MSHRHFILKGHFARVLYMWSYIMWFVFMWYFCFWKKNDGIYLSFQPYFVKKLSQTLEQTVKWFTDYTIMIINGFFFFFYQTREIDYRGKKSYDIKNQFYLIFFINWWTSYNLAWPSSYQKNKEKWSLNKKFNINQNQMCTITHNNNIIIITLGITRR